MEKFVQDLRYSLRLLRRTPGFTATAIAILALAIGVNSAMFSLLNELLWSARPFAQSDRVVQLYTRDQVAPDKYRLASYPAYCELRGEDTAFAGVLAHTLSMVSVGEKDSTRRVFASTVSSNYFSVLGVQLAQGRVFSADEEKPGTNPAVTIVSDAYWRRTGSDPALVGKTIRVNEQLFTVVGIAPPRFTGTMMLFGPDLYFPLGVHDQLASDVAPGSQPTLGRPNAYALFLIARLKPGVSMAAANSALEISAARLRAQYPAEQKNQTMHAGALPRLSTNTAPANDRGLQVLGTLLLAMSAVVLLIASLNLANLLLARGNARRREIAIRLALGGGRARLIRQLLTEGFVLSLAGGAVGLVLATWAAAWLVRWFTAVMPMQIGYPIGFSPAVFLATLGFCTGSTLVFALGPALRLTRRDPVNDLKQQIGEDPSLQRRRRWLPRHPLVVAQLALSLGLVVGAALFVRAALKAGSLDTGFAADATVLAEVDASFAGYDRIRGLQLYRTVTERLQALPGVQAVGVGSVVPLGSVSMQRNVRRAGLAVAPDAHPATAAEGRAFSADWNSIGSDYFPAMGLPLLRGRGFSAAECLQDGAPRVAVVDETLARQLYPDGDALGQHIAFGEQNAAMEIVGIVPKTRWRLFGSANGEDGTVYVPFAQGYQANAHFHVRFSPALAAQPATLETVRQTIRTSAPHVPLFRVQTFAQHLDRSIPLWVVRAGAVLFGAFGGLALLLATVGVYGVNAYAVSRRTREIGIRMALGAASGAVKRMILRETLAMAVTGLVLGLLLALAVGRLCAGLLYEVSPLDPLAFAAGSAVLAVAAMIACWLPARRASRVDPMVALRAD